MHAVERQKQQLASALGYKTNISNRDYGISKTNFKKPKQFNFGKYAVCVQNASWITKQWPIESWKELLKLLEKRFKLTFPSGSQSELDRASEICSVSEKAYALEVLPLDEVAFLIDNSKFTLCSDTGLAHVSAMVGTFINPLWTYRYCLIEHTEIIRIILFHQIQILVKLALMMCLQN